MTKHGADPKAGGYHDESQRLLRYEKLADIFSIGQGAPNQFTIAELGCGYGAFYIYLDEMLPGRISHYYGYDVSPEMIKTGKEYLAGKPSTLVLDNHVAHEADYVFLSGIFNLKGAETSDEDWRDFMQDTLRASFAKAKRGLAFNCLSAAKVDFRNERFFYYSPAEFMDFCNENMLPLYQIDQNYPLYEMTCCIVRR